MNNLLNFLFTRLDVFYRFINEEGVNVKKKIYGYPLTIPALTLYFLFFVVPVLAGLFMAFTDWDINRILEPEFNGLENFKSIFSDDRFLKSFINTILFALVTMFLKMAFGLLLALALVKPLWLKGFYRTVFFFPSVLSIVVIGIIFTSVLQMDGLFNQILGLFGLQHEINWLGEPNTAMLSVMFIDIWQLSGLTAMFFIAGLQAIPNEFYEAAKIDGASSFSQFKNITIPLLAPSFTITLTLGLVGGLKVFAQVFVLTNGGPGFSTQVLSTYIYQDFGAGLLGRSSAMSLVLTVLVAIITIVLNKFLRDREVEM